MRQDKSSKNPEISAKWKRLRLHVLLPCIGRFVSEVCTDSPDTPVHNRIWIFLLRYVGFSSLVFLFLSSRRKCSGRKCSGRKCSGRKSFVRKCSGTSSTQKTARVSNLVPVQTSGIFRLFHWPVTCNVTIVSYTFFIHSWGPLFETLHAHSLFLCYEHRSECS